MKRFSMGFGRRSAAVAACAVAATAVLGGSAYAYWTETGTGTGSATAGAGLTIKSTAEVPSSGFLFPSATPNGSLALTFTSPVNATVTGITKDPGRLITSSVANCQNYVEMNPITGLSYSVTAGVPLTPAPLINKVRMFLDAPANCQGATFTIPVVLTAQETS